MVWKKIMEICITKSVHRPKICFVGICTQQPCKYMSMYVKNLMKQYSAWKHTYFM